MFKLMEEKCGPGPEHYQEDWKLTNAWYACRKEVKRKYMS